MKKKKALLFLLFTALTTGCSIGALTSNKSSAGTATEKIADEGIHADIKDENEDYVAEYSILTKIEGDIAYFDGKETGKKYQVSTKYVEGLGGENNEGQEYAIVYHPSMSEEIDEDTIFLKEAEIMTSTSINSGF